MAMDQMTELDTGSFAAFYEHHRAPVARALTLTLRSSEWGNEAADEAFARAFRRWNDVSTKENPPGWVYVVGLNWARTGLKRRARMILMKPPDRGSWDPEPDPDLDAALRRLSLDRRAVVVLRYFLDWSIDDIAEALDLPPGTVKSRLHRALRELESTLGGRP